MQEYWAHIIIKIALVNNPLVSIIIPTYNRAHLIVETLDSISKQTYGNWECIIVDDGSTDDTTSRVEKYCKIDQRFRYHHRPKSKSKGANACRNYGFELSQGELVNWFDSDDWMHPEFLAIKLNHFKDLNLDFVISTSVDWHEDGSVTAIYDTSNHGHEISAFNFIKGTIHCITNDFMATKSSIGALRFNESLKSGQEYNFISRYLSTTVNGNIIEEILSKRRVHEGSIQAGVTRNREQDQLTYIADTLGNKFYLLRDIMDKGARKSEIYLVNSIMSLAYSLAEKKQTIPFYSEILNEITRVKGVKSKIFFQMAVVAVSLVGKGYRFLKKAQS